MNFLLHVGKDVCDMRGKVIRLSSQPYTQFELHNLALLTVKLVMMTSVHLQFLIPMYDKLQVETFYAKLSAQIALFFEPD